MENLKRIDTHHQWELVWEIRETDDKSPSYFRKKYAQKIFDTIEMDKSHPFLTELMSKFKPKQSTLVDSRYNVGHHCVAQIAREAASRINSNPKFSEGCLKFLNSAPIIQIYTYTKTVGEDVQISGFDAIYPPNFQGTVSLDASKTYSAVGSTGRFSFEYTPA